MENKDRLATHKKDQRIEDILLELEMYLSPVQKSINQDVVDVDKPIVFIVGCARSGSTALLQYLSETNQFCYPSNIMSRFYYAPYIGARIHQLLIDHDTKNEMSFHKSTGQHTSNLGKTSGADSPHEFWYFWRRYFKFDEIQKLTDDRLSLIDSESFIKDLCSIQAAFDKPLVMKAMNMNWNISYLHKILPKAYFIHIERDVAYNAQSLLLARQRFFGDLNKWYSFKPPEYDEIKKLSPEEQVASQVVLTNSAISEQLRQLPSDRYKTISYASFCSDPQTTLHDILQRIGIAQEIEESNQLVNGNKIKVGAEQWNLIKNACLKINQ